MEVLHSSRVGTPVGEVLCVASQRGVCAIFLDEQAAAERLDHWRRRHAPASMLKLDARADPQLQHLERSLAAYFAGDLQVFDVPVDARGTAFQIQVWSELKRIPFGTTVSYGEIGRRLGRPNASRAVGAANGANPIPIVVPCHRIVAAKGLGGFSGGIQRKLSLLRHEGVLLPV